MNDGINARCLILLSSIKGQKGTVIHGQLENAIEMFQNEDLTEKELLGILSAIEFAVIHCGL